MVTDPVYGQVNASAYDQPRLYAVLTDPNNNNQIITWDNPDTGNTEPVYIKAFADTGASGFAISQLHASGLYGVGNLNWQPEDYIGSYTETGVGGEEAGDVSRPFGVQVISGPVDVVDYSQTASYVAFGDYNLWVRRDVGTGELLDLSGSLGGGTDLGDLGDLLGGLDLTAGDLGWVMADPINLIGMPVIRQRKMLLDVTPIIDPLNAESGLGTYLLEPGEDEPPTQLTVGLVLRDFFENTPPDGEVFPSHADNPMVQSVTVSDVGGSITGDWLLDTGAGSSFVSFAVAKACGLIPENYASLADFMADYSGPTADIGGVGGALTVPILQVASIRVPTREGVNLVWANANVLVADIAGLDGVFGMNLLLPAVTVDQADPLGSLFDYSPGLFNTVVIDTVDAANPVMRLDASAAEGTVLTWLANKFDIQERTLASVAGLMADPDGDGRCNLVEYALGSNPEQRDSEVFKLNRANVGTEEFPEVVYQRAAGLSDVVCHVEVSSDLKTWSQDESDIALVSLSVAGDFETVTLRGTHSLSEQPKAFFRLVVETVR